MPSRDQCRADQVSGSHGYRRVLRNKITVIAMHLLHLDGESEVRLVVTLANEPARMLYESLSFEREA